MSFNRTSGQVLPYENVGPNVQFYKVYARSPCAFTDPENAQEVNIRITGDFSDESQRNFEVLLQAIGLRAMPTMMNDPRPVLKLEDEGAPCLAGQGFVWRFTTETPYVFENFSRSGTPGPVGLLIDELDGIVLPNGTVIRTRGPSKNIEFVRTELL